MSLIVLISLFVASVFVSRHYFGYLVEGEYYSPFAYSDIFIKGESAEKFNYLPEAVIWDETYAYAKYVNEILRGEFSGATIADASSSFPLPE